MQKEKGFSLIEVMMVVGLLGIVAMGFMTFMKNSTKTQKSMMMSGEIQIISSEIRGFLSKTGMCNHNFKGLNYSEEPLEITSIKRLNDKIKYEVGKKYGDARVQITKMQFNSFEADDKEGLIGTTKLEVYFSKGKDTYGGKELKKTINIDMNFDTNDIITACNVSGASSSVTGVNGAASVVSPGDIQEVMKNIKIDPKMLEALPDDGSGMKQKLMDALKDIQGSDEKMKEFEQRMQKMMDEANQ